MDVYSASAPEDIAIFVQNYGIESNETFTKSYKSKEKSLLTKAKKSKWEWRI